VGGCVYGDFCTGEIFLHLNGTSTVVLDSPLNVSSFGEDESGEAYVVGLLNGPSLVGSGSPGAAAADWTVVGVGDVNGDGRADIVWRHASGTVAVWLLDGPSVVGSGAVGGAANDWQIQ
jgi:hypothetical protein